MGNSDHNVYLWDIGTQKLIKKYNTHNDEVWCVKYDATATGGTGTGTTAEDSSGIGRRFASAGDDGLLQLYD